MELAESITIRNNEDIAFIDIANEHASATISLFGGHVLSYVPSIDNQERLWLSPYAYLNGERSIRGGIPICWPWFGNLFPDNHPDLPSHGFLRTQHWKIRHSEESDKGTTIVLAPSFTRAKGFEHECNVELTIFVGATLDVSLMTENTGNEAFSFTGALHTYFEVESITTTVIEGITESYIDKLDAGAQKPAPDPYRITAETDRVHLQSDSASVIRCKDNIIARVEHQNNDSIVVWNPWQSAASISDMEPFGYQHMLCVETAITQGTTLKPGERHTLIQRIDPCQVI